ncbi:sensor histidine kinase [Natrarchaeobius halalkaliphilus]|uniref:histidine kinase n=1 Tax=Natrarchaeobius halalkaliphilus TaxID=1679091 RepID=A0A3N6LP73_9EURY|nr:HAMP domain-containing sensor histidine kinase [Natrarchaeobius halalkaliphilus]RQG91223.1 sensor histidine kinase [Natrarchaeobius halalkaliphilus]
MTTTSVGRTGPSTIQLLVDDDANSDALSELLEERYSVIGADAESDGDLYLVDDSSFSTHRDRIEDLKSGSGPSFTPVVLVRRKGTRVNLSLPGESSESGPPLVDEVIDAPVRKTVLFRRLSNLLVRRQQFRRLEDQNDRLERFASVVSHDLRNPLQVASGRLELLEASVPESDREHLEIARESLDRMDDLIDDVLGLARAGKTIEETTAVVISDAARRAWTVVESDAADLNVPERSAAIVADADRLSSVFENLFRNAIEHGRNDVAIEVGVTDTGFYVADDGPGIPSEEREHVLERGYTTSDDGTGIGLDIVTSVADAHGWTVSVGESDGGGARFDVSGVDRPE